MKYDHIVLGAGSAGAILAARVFEHPAFRVIIASRHEPPDGPAIGSVRAGPL